MDAFRNAQKAHTGVKIGAIINQNHTADSTAKTKSTSERIHLLANNLRRFKFLQPDEAEDSVNPSSCALHATLVRLYVIHCLVNLQ